MTGRDFIKHILAIHREVKSGITWRKLIMLYSKLYIDLGWYVLPCYGLVELEPGRLVCSCGNPECPSPGKHPRTLNGVYGATNDINVIANYLELDPFMNIAIATGERSGILAIDIDNLDVVDRFKSQFEIPDDVLAQKTGKGKHYLFKYPEDWNGNGLPNRVGEAEVKGNGRYIMICPAKHIKGVIYKLENLEKIGKKENLLADLPPKLKEAIEKGGVKKNDADYNYLVSFSGSGISKIAKLTYVPKGKKNPVTEVRLFVPDGAKVSKNHAEFLYKCTINALVICNIPEAVIVRVVKEVMKIFCDSEILEQVIIKEVRRQKGNLINYIGKTVDLSSGTIPEGSRNNTLFSIGCVLKETLVGEHLIGAILWIINREMCKPPLNAREVSSIARSITNYVVNRVFRNATF